MSIRGFASVVILVAIFLVIVISNLDGAILVAVDENTWTRSSISNHKVLTPASSFNSVKRDDKHSAMTGGDRSGGNRGRWLR